MRKIFILAVAFLTLNSFNESRQIKKIEVEVINKAKLSKLIKERKGRILFLNLWATWCVPCREEFPSIVTLANEYKGEIEFANISVDYPDEVNSKIVPFLKSYNVEFASYINGFGSDEELINALDKKWNGALPATFIFDAQGNKLIFINGKKSYDEFKKELTKTLTNTECKQS